MSKISEELRGDAARELRTSRLSGLPNRARGDAKSKAASFKLLAHNEEWLDGEPQRSKARRLAP